jgi:hypothetical protein
MGWVEKTQAAPSLRANGSGECPPDDRLHEAIQSYKEGWIASSQELLAMTTNLCCSPVAVIIANKRGLAF